MRKVFQVGTGLIRVKISGNMSGRYMVQTETQRQPTQSASHFLSRVAPFAQPDLPCVIGGVRVGLCASSGPVLLRCEYLKNPPQSMDAAPTLGYLADSKDAADKGRGRSTWPLGISKAKLVEAGVSGLAQALSRKTSPTFWSLSYLSVPHHVCHALNSSYF